MMERKVRVRFAPSPTGPLHIGGVRTALFNYLYARRHGGEIILRIEDTDSNRFVPGAEDYINEAFAWLGIKFDEGVREGGPHGPYRQSQRRDIYRRYVKQLLDDGKAYIAFDTPEELEAKNFERYERYRAIEENEPMWEEYMMEDAEICVAAFGIASRVAKNAIVAARAEGIKVGLIRPITLWPFCSARIAELSKQTGSRASSAWS